MTVEYFDPINEHLLAEAARQVVFLAARRRDERVCDLAELVIQDLFCLCVTGTSDTMVGRHSTVYAAIVDDVLARVQRIAAEAAIKGGKSSRIDEASDQSFPASDPPSWIYTQ